MLGVATWGGEVREAGLGRICWDGPAVVTTGQVGGTFIPPCRPAIVCGCL